MLTAWLLLVSLSWTQGLLLPLTTAEVEGKVVVVDRAGARTKLACVNWYGAHMEGHVVNGLDRQPVASIANTIASLGFNCVRLPFSLEQFYDNPVIEADRLSANPDLVGLSSMSVFEAVVEGLTEAGLMVILNNHNSKAGWCCSEQDGEGLWWTDSYPEEMWLQALASLADTFSANSLVVGMDLRNELRAAHYHSPVWGGGGKYDWARAAETAGNLVLDISPHLLVIVEGLEYAGTVEGARVRPVNISRPAQLVYSGHMYPFWWDSTLPYQDFSQRVTHRQTFVREPGHQYSAGYWMGELGTGDDSQEWGKILRLVEEQDLDWAYWSIDGYTRPGEDESYGLLKDDYVTVRHPWLVQQLQRIQGIIS